jgi:hypothetical protein
MEVSSTNNNDNETPLSIPLPYLPNDVLACIFGQLSTIGQVKSVGRVCQQWYEVANRRDVTRTVLSKLFCCSSSFEAFIKPPFDLEKMLPMFKAVSNQHLTCKRDEDEFGREVYQWRQFERFDDMMLRESVLRGVYSYGFEKPSRIQTATGKIDHA